MKLPRLHALENLVDDPPPRGRLVLLDEGLRLPVPCRRREDRRGTASLTARGETRVALPV